MENNKLLSMIGLCRKAGKLHLGYDAVVEMANRGRLVLILTTSDLSPRSLKNIKIVGNSTSIPTLPIPVEMQELEERIGKKVGILGIEDTNFADAIKVLVA